MPKTGWKKLSAEEQRLTRKRYWEQGKAPSEIAGLLERDKSTLTRFPVKQGSRKKQGRSPVLTEADIDFLEHRLHQLIMKSMGKYHVTAALLKHSARSTASVKVRPSKAKNFLPQNAREAAAHRGGYQGSIRVC